MTTLVVAEHDNAALRPVTLNVVAAAQAIGGEFDILVAGSACASAWGRCFWPMRRPTNMR